MTVNNRYAMECDECGMDLTYSDGVTIYSVAVKALQRSALARQWKIEDEADYCPTCVEDLSQ